MLCLSVIKLLKCCSATPTQPKSSSFDLSSPPVSLSQPQMLCYTSSDIGKKVTGTWKIFVRNCQATKFLELHTTKFWKITCLSLQKCETTINVHLLQLHVSLLQTSYFLCRKAYRLTNILLLYHFSWATWDNVMIGVL